MPKLQDITAVVLAGGRGRRMHGADKGLVDFAGRPLVSHALDALAPQVGGLLISANRNLARYRQFGWPVVTDAGATPSCGPLAGVLAALRHCPTDYLLTVPCDAPFVADDYAARMATAIGAAAAAVAHDGARMQPVFALLHRRLLAPLQTHLTSGQLRARDFWLAQQATSVDFSDRQAQFVNLNRPQELAAARPTTP